MKLFYFDEVKYDPPNQRFYWFGGIALQDVDVPKVEADLNKLATDFFGSSTLTRETEFHGIEIVQGKGAFKGVDPVVRGELLSKILRIAAEDFVERFYVKLRVENFEYPREKPDETAFMLLLEIIEKHLVLKEELGMIFGDYDDPMIAGSVISLSWYKKHQTSMARGIPIERIFDTVHFAKSHHSRLVQLADVYLYCRQFFKNSNKTSWRSRVCEIISESGCLPTSFQRDWPIEKRWYG